MTIAQLRKGLESLNLCEMRILDMKIVLTYPSTNGTKTSNITIFQRLGCGWGGGALWDKFATGVVEIATLYEFDKNDRFFTTPVIHI